MSQYNPGRHHRRSIRLPAFDYCSAGAYFVTIVTHGRQSLFGEVVDDVMCRNVWGDLVANCWRAIPRHSAQVTVDEWVIMPNHMHGILILRPPTTIQDGGDDGGGHDGDDGENPGHGRGEASAPSFTGVPLPPSECFAPAAPRQDADANPRRHMDRTGPDSSSSRPVGTQSGSLGAVIQNFKSVTTRRIRRSEGESGGGAGGDPGRVLGGQGEAFADDWGGGIVDGGQGEAFAVDRGGGIVFGGQGEAFAEDPGGDPRFLAANASPLRSIRKPRVVWQRGYYEHVIRDETALDRIRRYIRENPLRWAIDAENPARRTR